MSASAQITNSLAERIDTIDEGLRALVAAGNTVVAPETLGRQLCGLAVTAAMGGMASLAETAVALGAQLAVLSTDSNSQPASQAVTRLLSVIKHEISGSEPASLVSPQGGARSAETVSKAEIFVATGSDEILLVHALHQRGYEAREFASADALFAACQDPGVALPAALVVNRLDPSIRRLKAAGVVILLVGDGSKEQAYVEAVRAGADRYLPVPINTPRLVEALERLVTRKPVSVLLIDDDPLSLAARSAVLWSAGFEVTALRHLLDVQRSLQSLSADVVVVDTAIPDAAGLIAVMCSIDEAWSDSILLSGAAIGVDYLPRAALSESAAGLVAAVAAVAGRTRAYSDKVRRLQAQRRLRLRKNQASNANAMICVTDEFGVINHVNSEFCAVSGYSREELLGKDHRMINSLEHPPEFYSEVWQTLSSGSLWRGLIRNRRKDGSRYWTFVTISPGLDSTGKPVEFVSHFVVVLTENDEHDYPQSEPLQEIKAQFRLTLGAVDGGIMAVDAQQKVLFCNRSLEDLGLVPWIMSLAGSRAIVASGQAHRWVKAPEQFERRITEIEAAPRDVSHDVIEHLDGRQIEVDSMPWTFAGAGQGRVWHFREQMTVVGVLAAHSSAADRLQLGQRFANIGTRDWNVETGVMVCSEQVPVLFGLPCGEFETTFNAFIESVHPDDRDAVQRAVQESVEQGVAYSIEYRVRWPDETVRWLSERGNVVCNQQGTVQCLIGVVHDIDDSKRAAMELMATREEAERANQAKSEFLSRMSHELRTPMNAVLGFAQIMEYDDTLPPDHLDSVNEIIRAGGHLLELINEVLDLSKVESGSVDLAIEPVALRPVVQECLSLVNASASRRGITITNTVDAATVVRVDRRHLKQSLLNLMSNGVKYNSDNGQLTVDVIGVRDGGWVQLRVSDTGMGVEAEDLSRLFEPFDRLDVDSSDIEGAGIGLAITRRLMEMTGGSVGVSSVPGSGSTFWLELQREHTLEPGELESGFGTGPDCDEWGVGEAPGGDYKDKAALQTILYVEDNTTSIRLMAEILSHREHVRLLTAHTAERCIELVMRQLPDLVIIDTNMPGLDAYRVLRTLRAGKNRCAVPVVALSGTTLPSDIDRGDAEGFSDYISKPLQIDYVLKILDRYLSKATIHESDIQQAIEAS